MDSWDFEIFFASSLLSASDSIEIIATQPDDFLGGPLEALLLVDQRIQKRCILPESIQESHPALLSSLREAWWEIKLIKMLDTVDVLVADHSFPVVGNRDRSGELVKVFVFSDDFANDLIRSQFNQQWHASTDLLLLENLFVDPQSDQEQRILQVSTDNWNELLDRLKSFPEEVHSMSPRKFEEFIAKLLERDGFSIELTPQTRDGGRDIIAKLDSSIGQHLYLVECKKYAPNRPIDVSIVRALYGVLHHENATAGLIVTTSYFSKDALKFREPNRYRMNFKDYQQLVTWIRQE